MSILVNKPASVSADSITSLEINKTDLQAKLTALNANAYWKDQNTWKGVAFLFENADKQKVTAVFDIASGVVANLIISEFFFDGIIECKRIDVIGFANDYYSINRSDFTSASEFDIEITNGYQPGGGTSPTLALYHFDGNLNGANGNNLNYRNVSPAYVVGKFSQGVSDINTSGGLYRDAAFFNVGSGDFTIECWAKFSFGNDQDLFSIHDAVNPYTKTFNVMYRPSNDNFTIYSNGGNYVGASPAAGLRDGNWHHIVMQRNTGSLRVFIDGVLAGGAHSFSYNIPVSGYNMGIGYGGDGNPNLWQGSLDECRISNVAIYNIAGFTPPNSPLT